MIENNISPSQFEIVPRGTTVHRCLAIMKKKNLSFLLIQGLKGEIEGIFTLKDVLKSYDYLTNKKKLLRPVSVVMSRPVIALPVEEIDQASNVMVTHKIRHLPITHGKDNHIIGVIDMECLLAHDLKEQTRPKILDRKEISVFSPDGALIRFLKGILEPHDQVGLEKLWASRLRNKEDIQDYVQHYDLFCFDLVDFKGLRFCTEMMPYISGQKKKSLILVDEDKFVSEAEQNVLQHLVKAHGTRLFTKPVNIHQIVEECAAA